MARTSHVTQWIGLTVIGFMLTGCVSQEKYNAAKMESARLSEQLAQQNAQLQAAQAQAETYKNLRDRMMMSTTDKEGLAANLQAQLQEMQKNYDELNRKYGDALSRGARAVALPEELTSALQTFAQQNPDLVDFDQARGIVKFKSDITFSVGSAQLTDRARPAIDRFAQILNSASASTYELQVAGHTDSTPVASERTIKSGHKNNWFLSSHRAISVSEELQRQGVSPTRLAVVGYADQHPVASNASEAGKAANRRVEVLILPTQVQNGGGAVAGAGPQSDPITRRRTPTRGKIELNKDTPLNKDTAAVDRHPINK